MAEWLLNFKLLLPNIDTALGTFEAVNIAPTFLNIKSSFANKFKDKMAYASFCLVALNLSIKPLSHNRADR